MADNNMGIDRIFGDHFNWNRTLANFNAIESLVRSCASDVDALVSWILHHERCEYEAVQFFQNYRNAFIAIHDVQRIFTPRIEQTSDADDFDPPNLPVSIAQIRKSGDCIISYRTAIVRKLTELIEYDATTIEHTAGTEGNISLLCDALYSIIKCINSFILENDCRLDDQ